MLYAINFYEVLTMVTVSAVMLFTVKKNKKTPSCCHSFTLKNIIFKVNVIQNKLYDEEL
jgi:glutaredoxin-related protein